MYKIGLSSSGKVICEELFESYQKAGIYGMEVTGLYENQINYDFNNIKKMADSFGVKLWSHHLPFKPFDLIDLADRKLCENTVKIMGELIKKSGSAGIDKFVVHSSGIVKRDLLSKEEIHDKMECAKESLADLAEIAHAAGGNVCVENLPPICLPTSVEEVRELVSADDRLRVCVDTNHMLEGTPVDFIKGLADRLVTLHISDFDFENERHWMPGRGVINWQEVYATLKEVNYSGIWLYEIGPKSGDRIYECKDFVQNANDIFENKELGLYGIKNPEK